MFPHLVLFSLFCLSSEQAVSFAAWVMTCGKRWSRVSATVMSLPHPHQQKDLKDTLSLSSFFAIFKDQHGVFYFIFLRLAF